MFFPRSSVVALMASIYFWSLVLRYPSINGEYGADSYVVHWFSSQIIIHGKNSFILNPLSYTGMYPFSNPFAVPTIISSFSLLTDINIENSILITNMCYGILGINLCFMAAKKLLNNDFNALMSVMVFSTTYYFNRYTFWSASSRGLFMVFVPFMLYSLTTWYYSRYELRNLFLIMISYVCLLSMHRMSTFMVTAFIIPFILFGIILYLQKKYNLHRYQTGRTLPKIVLILIFAPFLISIFFPETFYTFNVPLEHLWITEYIESGLLGPLINVGLSYSSNSILSPFILLGVISLIFKNFRLPREILLILLLLFQIPFVVNLEYFMPVFITIMSICGGYGIQRSLYLFKKDNSPLFISCILTLLIISSFSYSYYLKEINTNLRSERYSKDSIDGYGLEPENRNTGVWIDEFIEPDDLIYPSPIEWAVLCDTESYFFSDFGLLINHPNLLETIKVETYSPLNVFLHQKEGYYYGGFVEDWYFGTESISTFEHREMVELFSPFKSQYLIEQYQIKYFLHSESYKERSIKPTTSLSEHIAENNYIIYSNELSDLSFFKDSY